MSWEGCPPNKHISKAIYLLSFFRNCSLVTCTGGEVSLSASGLGWLMEDPAALPKSVVCTKSEECNPGGSKLSHQPSLGAKACRPETWHLGAIGVVIGVLFIVGVLMEDRSTIGQQHRSWESSYIVLLSRRFFANHMSFMALPAGRTFAEIALDQWRRRILSNLGASQFFSFLKGLGLTKSYILF